MWYTTPGAVDFLYFVLLVGALVLVHELGHFTAARIFGVKVLTFSFGFGPTLFEVRGRETTFRVGAFPFGGFVRLLEDPKATPRATFGRNEGKGASGERGERGEKGQELPEEDRKRTYQAQPLWARALIALAGPAMNIIVPFFIFFAVMLEGRSVTPPVIGHVIPGSPADVGLRVGDRIVDIDGEGVDSFNQAQEIIAKNPGKKMTFHVVRSIPATPSAKAHEETLEVVVTPRSVTETRDFEAASTIGRIGIAPATPLAVIGVSDPRSAAYRAGLRTFDVITHVRGVPTPRFVDLELAMRDNSGVAVLVSFLRPTPVRLPGPQDGEVFLEVAVYQAGVVMLAPEPSTAAEGDGLRRAGIETADLFVASAPEGSSEWRAGLRRGDRVLAVDGKPMSSWAGFVEDLIGAADRTREVSFARDGQTLSGLLRVRKEDWIDATGERLERYVVRATHWMPSVPPALVGDPAPLSRAFFGAIRETANVVRFLSVTALRVVQGRVPTSAISGPISIADVAGRAGERGARDFLWVMALVSVNLGLLNLLPIPTLDGGQLLFLVVEGVMRRPVSVRVRGILSIAGLAMLLVLMAIAIHNDIGRHWQAVVGPIRHLFRS